jgi:ribosomal protein S18 acetylase RimI-like enzyme
LTVELKNSGAIYFYKKLGFEIEGARKKLFNGEGEFINNY